MTQQEILILKRYAEGAYPSMKQDKGSDAVWADMLAPYDYQGMMNSLKSHIRSGNRYQPTLAELISGYSVAEKNMDSEIIEQMERDGVFNDSEGTDEDIASWNRRNRVEKAKAWLSHPMRDSIIPGWFKAVYERYKGQANRELIVSASNYQLE